MRRLSRIRWKAAGFWAVTGAGVLLVGLAAFFFAGLYNVAATARHFAVTEWLIGFALHRSLALYSLGVTVPELDDPDLIRLGANHFELGCAPCHGSPAAARNPLVTAMYPGPPSLSEAAPKWGDAELFRIVRHGVKMTGMPAWTGRGRDGEVWAVVAFVRRLPEMDAAEYRALTAAEPMARPTSFESGVAEPPACAACHGDGRTPPVSPLVPSLQGQKIEYLLRAMREYRGDARQSGIMEPVAAAVRSDALPGLLRELANGDSPSPATVAGEPESIRRGRTIAVRGVPEAQVPPCLACHSRRSAETFPLLEGLSQEYLTTQLALFRNGVRSGTGYGAIMAAIAPRLSPAQVADVTAYFAAARPDRGDGP